MVQAKTDQEQYNELSYYTLAHTDSSFIHQYIVDAYIAQTANKNTKPIAITFALAGLYLHIEKGFTGKQVQNMHMRMARKKVNWPLFDLPKQRGEIIATSVLATPSGIDRDIKIDQWCNSVWEAYSSCHKKIANILQHYLE